MNDNKYANGKIYRIENDVNDMLYIGSTTMTLKRRLTSHKCACVNRTTSLYSNMREIGAEHFWITLVEEHPCVNRAQLESREYEVANTFPREKLYNERFDGKVVHTNETKNKMRANRLGTLNHQFKRGFISKNSTQYLFTWSVNGVQRRKHYSFVTVRTEQKAYMMCVEYRDSVYPLTNRNYLQELPFALEEEVLQN